MRIMVAYFEQFIELSGGVERMGSELANALVERGHNVSFVYCYGRNGECFYPLDHRIKIFNLMTLHKRHWKNNALSQCVPWHAKMVRELLRAFSPSKARDWNEQCKGKMIAREINEVVHQIQPDVIVSLRYETSNYILNSAHITVPVVTRSFMNPDFMLAHAPIGEIQALQRSRAVHVLVKGDVQAMKKYCPDTNIVWIPNPVPQYKESADLGAQKNTYTIINVARLNKTQKQQHLLIQAFARLASEFPNWDVEIWGGENDARHGYTKELEELIKINHLEQRVFLKGETHDVLRQYLHSDIFCFPSAHEGFGNALAEALSAGLPAVVFRSCPAVGDLVEDGKNGIRCDDGVDGLSEALKKLMAHQNERVKMGQYAKISMQQYAPQKVWDMWEDLIVNTGKEDI